MDRNDRDMLTGIFFMTCLIFIAVVGFGAAILEAVS